MRSSALSPSQSWAFALVSAITLAVAGCSSSATSSSPSPAKCQISVTLPQGSMPAGGGAGTVSVATTSDCKWTAASESSWITGLTPGSGQGAGSLQFQVSANPAAAIRNGRITLNDVAASITQAGASCDLVITPTNNQPIDSAGGTGTVTVSTASGCPWTASAADSWLTVTSGASGTGSGTVGYSVSPNSGATRAGALTIGGQSFAVNQLGSRATPPPPPPPPTPTPTPTPTPAPTPTPTPAPTPTPTPTPAPTPTPTPAPAPAPAPTPTPTPTPTPNCTIAINPANQSVAAAGGQAASVSVTANSGCTWTTTSSQSWITVTAGVSGSGSGVVRFTVAANTGPARTGTLAIGGQTHAVSQADGCSFALNPKNQHFNSDAATGKSIAVATGAGCAWTATANDSWIKIDSGASGTGPGSVVFSVTKNSGSSNRTGTLTIAGVTFTVTQDKK